jgi:hypothetical protein
VTYRHATAAPLLDPYSQFLIEGAKVWTRLTALAKDVRGLDDTTAIGRPPGHRQDFDAGEALSRAPLEASRNLP